MKLEQLIENPTNPRTISAGQLEKLKKSFMLKVPIPLPNKDIEYKLEVLVNEILKLKNIERTLDLYINPPLHLVDEDHEMLEKLEKLPSKILKAKSELNLTELLASLESKIDDIVYKIYDLTDEEIRYIER